MTNTYRYCPECGSRVLLGMRFCTRCGTPIPYVEEDAEVLTAPSAEEVFAKEVNTVPSDETILEPDAMDEREKEGTSAEEKSEAHVMANDAEAFSEMNGVKEVPLSDADALKEEETVKEAEPAEESHTLSEEKQMEEVSETEELKEAPAGSFTEECGTEETPAEEVNKEAEAEKHCETEESGKEGSSALEDGVIPEAPDSSKEEMADREPDHSCKTTGIADEIKAEVQKAEEEASLPEVSELSEAMISDVITTVVKQKDTMEKTAKIAVEEVVSENLSGMPDNTEHIVEGTLEKISTPASARKRKRYDPETGEPVE